MKFFLQLILLLVTLPGRKATPLRPYQHKTLQPITSTFEREIQRLKAENLEDETQANILGLLVLHETVRKTDRAQSAPRRAPPRGCQLGTCQLHNLANTLYRIGQTNGKDESKRLMTHRAMEDRK